MESHDMATRIAALEGELANLKQELTDRPDATSSRRDVFKKLAIAGAGAAAGAVVMARPAAANTGDTRFLGVGQEAANMTYLRNGTAAGSFATGDLNTAEATMFWVDNRLSALPAGHGIRGDGKGVLGRGLWGHSDSNGIGVAGDGGIGVLASGARAALQVADTGTAPPTPCRRPRQGRAHHGRQRRPLVLRGRRHARHLAPGLRGRHVGSAAPARHAGARVRLAPRRHERRPVVRRRQPQHLARRHHDQPGRARRRATGAMVSLTLDSTVSSGFLALFAKGIPWPGNSNANWYTNGQILAVTTVTAVDTTAAATVLAGGPGSTQIIIDVIGYYR